jgi:hypothetical protein
MDLLRCDEEWHAAMIERNITGRRIDAGDGRRAGIQCPI